MNRIVGLKDLCTPSYVYLVISVTALILMTVQNFGNADKYCLGPYKCDDTNTILVFVVKLLYVLFWTWLLNVMCRGGATSFAWFLVLFPFILMFIIEIANTLASKEIIIVCNIKVLAWNIY